MPEEEKYDFAGFVSTLRDLAQPDQRGKVQEELARTQNILVREGGVKFDLQMYTRRVERLSRFLGGQDVAAELTPSEKRAYELLTAGAHN